VRRRTSTVESDSYLGGDRALTAQEGKAFKRPGGQRVSYRKQGGTGKGPFGCHPASRAEDSNCRLSPRDGVTYGSRMKMSRKRWRGVWGQRLRGPGEQKKRKRPLGKAKKRNGPRDMGTNICAPDSI